MRSSLFVFVIGFLLGSTLGLGGLYTQVLQPAWQEMEELERENGVMKEVLQEAGTALREAADNLREDDGPRPMSTGDITGTDTTRTTRMTSEERETETTTIQRTDRRELVTRLETIAGRLEKATDKTDE